MLYTSLTSDLPVFDRGVIKVLARDARGRVVRSEHVHLIETDDEGNVVRIAVCRTTHIYHHMNAQGHQKTEIRDYMSRPWITRIMREYAHIAARRLTPALV